MIKKIILFIIFTSSLFAAEVKELKWPRGESFLSFLEKYSIPQKLYFDLPKEDKELASEIVADKLFYLYENDDGTLNQVLIPVSEDIQLHIYEESEGLYKFQTLPINYDEIVETIAIPINSSVSYDIQKATGNIMLAAQLKAIFGSSVNFRAMQKGNIVAIKYKQKVLMGKPHGFPEILAAMVEVHKSKYFRFRNEKNDKFYDEKGRGFTKEYFFRVPLTYKRISSKFTRKRWHPVLKRYRAHLGTDFAAPTGRKLYAAGDGRVEYIGWRGGYGKTIIIRHPNGYKTLYAHQHKFSSRIKRGQRVRKGQHIGYVGSTGLSSGPHLHLGVYKNGRAVDPLKVIRTGKQVSISKRDKKAFLSTVQQSKEALLDEVNSENRNVATRFDRINYKSDLEQTNEILEDNKEN